MSRLECCVFLQGLMVSEIKEKITQIAGPNDYRFRNFPQLDGFRGLAIALVMCGHMMSFASGSLHFRQIGDYVSHLWYFSSLCSAVSRLRAYCIENDLLREPSTSNGFTLEELFGWAPPGRPDSSLETAFTPSNLRT